MKLFVAITGHASLWPHFLRHYAGLGVDEFFAQADPELTDRVRADGSGLAVTVVGGRDARESIEGGTLAVTELRRRFAAEGEWVMLADLDEFQSYPLGLRQTVAAAESEGANVVRGKMIDRVAGDGSLPAVSAGTDLWRAFPARCALTARLQGGLDYKCALVKGHLRSARTADRSSLAHHHMADERVATERIEIHHFKWNAELLDRLETAIARTRAAEQPFWQEYVRVIEHWRAHGRLRWEEFPEA